VALGANGQVTFTGYLAEASGYTGINYALSSSATGSSGGLGSLGPTNCQRGSRPSLTAPSPTTAPALVSANSATWVWPRWVNSSSRAAAEILLNTAGISSNPATHQAQLDTPVSLGTSGGNNNDYDTRGNQIVTCCGGTPGSLIQDSRNRQYLLSNNHVLGAERTMPAWATPSSSQGLLTTTARRLAMAAVHCPIGSLTGWLALKSSATNADAAIAQVNSGAVNTAGRS